MKKLILIFFLFSISYTNAEKKILFIGNSISEPWLEMRLNELSDSAGKDLFIQTLSFGGYSLSDHVNSPTTHEWIDSLDWDYVVLQEGPGILASDSVACDQYMFEAVDSLYHLIKTNNPCTEVVFFMPWGLDDSDTNTAPDENFFNQQNQISENTLRYSHNFFSITAPVGRAWKEVRTEKPWIALYRDVVHANHTGHFLSAGVFYSLTFNESPVNIKNSSFVSEFIGDTLADYLKDLSGQIVLDSLDKWNYFVNIPEADFTYQKEGLKVTFISDKNAPSLKHSWLFGDGDSSNEISPEHIYIEEDEYSVRHLVESECYPPDEEVLTINLTTGIEEILKNGIRIYPNPNNGIFRIELGKVIPDEIRIYDVLGMTIYQSMNNKSNYLDIHIDGLSQGIYYLRINQIRNYQIIIVNKF